MTKYLTETRKLAKWEKVEMERLSLEQKRRKQKLIDRTFWIRSDNFGYESIIMCSHIP